MISGSLRLVIEPVVYAKICQKSRGLLVSGVQSAEITKMMPLLFIDHKKGFIVDVALSLLL